MTIPDGHPEFKRSCLKTGRIDDLRSDGTNRVIVPTGCVVEYYCSKDFLKTKPALEILCENGTLKSLQGNEQEKDTVCIGISAVFISNV